MRERFPVPEPPETLKHLWVFDDFWFPSPKTRQDVPKKPQDPLQDAPRRLQDAQKTRQDAPKRPQDAPGSLQKPSKTNGLLMISGFRAPRRAKTYLRSSRSSRRRPKAPPRRPKDAPRRSQEAPGRSWDLQTYAFFLRPTPQLKVTVKVNWNAGIPLDWIRLKLIGAGGIREAIRVWQV